MNVIGKMSNIIFWNNHENQGPKVKFKKNEEQVSG